MKKWFCLALLLANSALAQGFTPPSLWLNELTWPEVKQAMQAGYTRILIPTAGTEQNGHHLILGKHHHVITATADAIARKQGNTLIAPVLDYVPEEVHMSYPGTISLSEDTFAAVLEETAESLKQHGFKQIYFLGDSFGNQPPQQEVAEDLADDFADDGVLIATLSDYYAKNGQIEWLVSEGIRAEDIGGHAGIRDTSELQAAYPQGVREDKIKDSLTGDAGGAEGKATQASASLGRQMLDLKNRAAVQQIKALEGAFKP